MIFKFFCMISSYICILTYHLFLTYPPSLVTFYKQFSRKCSLIKYESHFYYIWESLQQESLIKLNRMSQKQESSPASQLKNQKQKDPPFASPPKNEIKENHLSSTHEKILLYEQRNQEIQFVTKTTKLEMSIVEKEMEKPLQKSQLKGEQIFHKYGSMIQFQPYFLRQIIHNYYINKLPEQFRYQFNQINTISTVFQVAWWGSLAFFVIRAIRNRKAEIELRERATKGLVIGFLYFAASFGFYQSYFTPKLKNVFYKNIKLLDSFMDRHIKVLRLCGAQIENDQQIQMRINQSLNQKKQVRQTNMVSESAKQTEAKVINPLVNKNDSKQLQKEINVKK